MPFSIQGQHGTLAKDKTEVEFMLRIIFSGRLSVLDDISSVWACGQSRWSYLVLMMRSADEWRLTSMCEGDVLISCYRSILDNTRKTCHVFRTDRVAFVGIAEDPFDLWRNSSRLRVVLVFCRPRISVAIRSMEVAMLARTAKSQRERSRGRTCVRFLEHGYQACHEPVLLYNGGMWQSSQPRRNLTSFTSNRVSKRSMLRFVAVPSRKFETKGCRLSVHHEYVPCDGELIAPLSDDVGKFSRSRRMMSFACL